MARPIYSAIMSLDGYVADQNGTFDWAAPDEAVHTVVNDLERPIGAYPYGRRMYEVMVAWETMDTLADQPPAIRDFAQLRRAAEKIVYSRTRWTVSSAGTRIEREPDPEAARQLKAAAGRDLAAQAIKAGLVDECHLFVTPVVVGGGTTALPARSAWNSNCWTSAGSPTARSTSITAPGREVQGGTPERSTPEHQVMHA